MERKNEKITTNVEICIKKKGVSAKDQEKSAIDIFSQSGLSDIKSPLYKAFDDGGDARMEEERFSAHTQ